MYQFFVEPQQIAGKRIMITGSDVNHIKNVLRMKGGEEIAVSNGVDGREYRCRVERITEQEVICTLLFIKEDGIELPARVFLFQGLPKADKMELIIQKAVELSQIKVDIIDGGGSHFLYAAMEIFLNDLLIRLSDFCDPLSLEPVEVPPCNPFHIAHGVWVEITTGKESLHNLRIISVQFVPGTPFGNIP